jgi:uncharacterized membrane protein YfcA
MGIWEHTWPLLFALLPLSAFLYASVGHGGASSYLMLLTLFNFSPEQIRPTALMLNIAVSFLAFLSYRGTCVFPWRLFFSLALCSVPAAYLGGTIDIDPVWYKRILGLMLLFPIFRFLGIFPVAEARRIPEKTWMAPALGLAIGFLSGLIGIGGGIILSPVLLLFGWTNMRETAALSALFILVNSISGLFGANPFLIEIEPSLWALMPATILAGALGAWYGARKFNVQTVKYILTSVLAFAAIKLMLA